MLPLTDPDTWKQLENPYGNSADLPALIAELEKSFSTEILNEICWEYIYHQNSLYEATFATIPHLIRICEKSTDPNFKMAAFMNMGVILAELDVTGILVPQTFDDSTLEKETVAAIINSYNEAFKRLRVIGHSLFNLVPEMQEGDKRIFLAAWASACERYEVGKIFVTYTDNDEYMCLCPDCDSEFHLWNEDNKLILYTEDPVFHKDQTGHPITPKPLPEVPSIEKVSPANHFEWLVFYIDQFNVQSLKPIVGYLFGEAVCPECEGGFEVFDGVSGPLG